MTVGGSTAEMKSWEKGMYELWFRSKSKLSSLYSWMDDFTNPWLDGGRQKQIRIKPCSLSIRINPSKFNHGSMRSSLLSKVVGWGRTELVWKRHGWTRMDWCGLISTNSNGQLGPYFQKKERAKKRAFLIFCVVKNQKSALFSALFFMKIRALISFFFELGERENPVKKSNQFARPYLATLGPYFQRLG